MRGEGGEHEGDPAAFRYLARVCADHATGAPTTAWSMPADAKALERLAVRHRLCISVLGRLASAVRPHDPEVADRLAARATRRNLVALQRTERLAIVSAGLSAAGIAHLAIKGPVLAQRLYGDVAARDSKDLDLLIDPAAIDAATPVLAGLGFHPADDPSTHQGSVKKDRSFICGRVELEVHSRLLDVDALLPMPFEDIWERRAMVTLGPAALPTLSDVDTLLYLCAHGAAHLWFRLKWLEDIARIVVISDAGTIDEAMGTARRAGAEAILVGALHLVEQLFGITPAGRGAAIPSTRASRALVALSREAMAAPAELASSPPLGWIVRKLPVQFGMARGWRYRRELIRILVLSPHHFDVTGLPRGLGWLRLPLRPFMLLRHRLIRSAPGR